MIFLCAEFACYSILYRHIDNHDKEMLHSAVITDKVFRKRKSVHAVSLMGQHICFWAEFLHLLIVYLIRLIGERFIGIDALELMVTIKWPARRGANFPVWGCRGRGGGRKEEERD
jgi:hypothetical protein